MHTSCACVSRPMRCAPRRAAATQAHRGGCVGACPARSPQQRTGPRWRAARRAAGRCLSCHSHSAPTASSLGMADVPARLGRLRAGTAARSSAWSRRLANVQRPASCTSPSALRCSVGGAAEDGVHRASSAASSASAKTSLAAGSQVERPAGAARGSPRSASAWATGSGRARRKIRQTSARPAPHGRFHRAESHPESPPRPGRPPGAAA